MEYRRLGRTDLRVSAIGARHHDLRRAEHRSRGPRADGLCASTGASISSTPPSSIRSRRSPRRRDAPRSIIGSWLEGARHARQGDPRHQDRRPHGLHWFRDDGGPTDLSRGPGARGGRQEPEAARDRLYRSLPDPLARPHRSPASVRCRPSSGVRGPEVPIEETLGARRSVKAGKIRHVGLSNESPWGTMTFLQLSETKGLPRVQSIQNAYSLINRTFETGPRRDRACARMSGLLAYSPLGQGYSDRQVPERRAAGRRPQDAVRPDAALREARRRRGDRGLCRPCPRIRPRSRADGDPLRHDAALRHLGIRSARRRMEQLETDIDAADSTSRPDLEERIDAIHLLHQNPCP